MKQIKFILLTLIISLCICGCSNGGKENITYKQLEKKVNNKETFILEIMQTGCSACENFDPRFEKILKQENVIAYSINLKNLSDEENKLLDKIVTVNSTPTVIFFKEGKEESVSHRIIGAVPNDKIIQKLKAQGYIK